MWTVLARNYCCRLEILNSLQVANTTLGAISVPCLEPSNSKPVISMQCAETIPKSRLRGNRQFIPTSFDQAEFPQIVKQGWRHVHCLVTSQSMLPDWFSQPSPVHKHLLFG
jgi:hypothetical protein